MLKKVLKREGFDQGISPFSGKSPSGYFPVGWGENRHFWGCHTLYLYLRDNCTNSNMAQSRMNTGFEADFDRRKKLP